MDTRKLNDAVKVELHERLAQELLKRLKAAPCVHCERGYISHQELTVIRQFLSDNGITSVARPNTPLHSLTSGLPFVDPDESTPRKEAQ